MNEFIKCSECGYDCEPTDIFCPSCGEVLPIAEEECDICQLNLSAGELTQMFGDE